MVVVFVAGAEALEDFEGFFLGGFADEDGLEAALEGGVLFDEAAVFVEGGGADDLDFAAGEGGLEDVGGVHGALGAAGADEGVEFVDEEDDVLDAADFFHDGLDALFELAAVLGAGDHEGEVEGDEALAAEELGDFVFGDGLGEAFDDGGLADAGFAEQDGVVLGAAAEDAHDALDFVGAADDGVEFALAGEFGDVASEGGEGGGGVGLLAAGGGAVGGVAGAVTFHVVGGVLGALGAHGAGEVAAEGLGVDVEVHQDADGDAVAFAQEAEEHVLGADVFFAGGACGVGGQGEDFLEARGVGEVAGELHGAAGADLLLDRQAQGVDAQAFGEKGGQGAAVAEEGDAGEEVFGADVAVVEAVRFLAGLLEGFLGFGGEVVHGVSLGFEWVARGLAGAPAACRASRATVARAARRRWETSVVPPKRRRRR